MATMPVGTLAAVNGKLLLSSTASIKRLSRTKATLRSNNNSKRACLPPVPADLSPDDQKRWYIVAEIVTHEQNYLDGLHKLDKYIFPVMSLDHTIVDEDIAQKISAVHQHICMLHEVINSLMEKCVEDWPTENVAGWMVSAMLEQPVLLHWYKKFIKRYKQTVQLYTEECQRNSRFASYVTDRLRAVGGQRTFQDYFILPVQRMPQLFLQLKELAKYTPETHKDRVMVDRCIKRVDYLEKQLNEASGNNETVETVLHAIEKWDPFTTFAHGQGNCHLLHSGVLRENFKKDCIVLLLSDRLVCAELPDRKSEAQCSEQKVCSRQTKAIGELIMVTPLEELDVVCGQLDEFRLDLEEGMRDFMSMFEEHDTTPPLDMCLEDLGELCSNSQAVLNSHSIYAIFLLQSSEPERDAPKLISLRLSKDNKYLLLAKTADEKKEWCYNIRMAKLALRPENCIGWWHSVMCPPYEALFSESFKAGDLDGVWSVTGACCFVPTTTSSAYSNEQFRTWSKQHHVLWLISQDTHSSKISLYNHDRKTHRIDMRANIDFPNVEVTSMVYVPVGQVGDTATDTVWIITDSHMLVYSATYPMIDKQLKSISIESIPGCLFYHGKRVFVSMLDGRLLVFSLKANDVWDMENPQQSDCGFVSAMCAVDSYVYMAIDTRLYVYDNQAGDFVKQLFFAPCGSFKRKQRISLLLYSIHGLWIARRNCDVISLYHAKHHVHLQDINIIARVYNFMIGHLLEKSSALKYLECVTVTSMQIIDNFLWIGTNVGLLLSLPLPQSANVPITAYELAVSHHGHLADVKVIVSLPSLRAPEEPEPENSDTDIDPLLIDKLYISTRMSNCDFSVRRPDVSFWDQNAPDESNNTSKHSMDMADETTSGKEEAAECSTWAPNSTLIITGGSGCIKRCQYTFHNRPFPDLSHVYNTSIGVEVTDIWDVITDDKKENVVVWEKRLK
ncbi:rho guanine nucleotide exchange factor 17 [Anopheles maculipalpis]|uniref:rho guanine nucleotide exchange factor 17 n=1 Tax=Anopheles maculipalpis TaxID=1496333 RepID=UPI00215907C6|nr:rho guanine nucleotide exchange factor 17 [Anopheles maculipalpis]